MSKISFKILLPLVAIAYCIAFFEIELGGVEQTWGDEYDTYLTSSHSSDSGSYTVSNQPDLTFSPFYSFYFDIAPRLQVSISIIKINRIKESPPPRLFIRNCTWLI